MANLPTNRTTANTPAEHVADHNVLHADHNLLEGGSNGQVLTKVAGAAAWAAPSGSSVRGMLANGYAQVTANQGTFTAITDLTGLTVTVTVDSGERIKITGQAAFATSAGNDRVDLWIYEGAAAIARSTVASPSTTANSVFVTATAFAILTPSAGSHTYKLRAERGAGTGNVTMSAAATVPAFIMVEGIGT